MEFKVSHVYLNTYSQERILLVSQEWVDANKELYYASRGLISIILYPSDIVDGDKYECLGPATKLELAIYGL